MSGTDAYGKPNKSAKEQYDYIISTLKIDKKYLQYDSSGNQIFTDDMLETDENGKVKKGEYKDEAYASAVQAFWDKIEADKEEM
jgi:hypothetical protein